MKSPGMDLRNNLLKAHMMFSGLSLPLPVGSDSFLSVVQDSNSASNPTQEQTSVSQYSQQKPLLSKSSVTEWITCSSHSQPLKPVD